MKNYLLNLFVLAAAFTMASQSALALPTWAENYGVGSYDANGKANSDPFYGSGFDYPRAIAPMPDGGFVVAGQIAFPFLTLHSTTNGASDAVLVRFGPDGTILWQQELRQTNDQFPGNGTFTPAPSYVSRIRTDAQGNIFVAGGKGNPANSGQVPFVAKFSPAGQLIWQNGIPSVGGTVPGSPPQSYTAGVSGSSLEIGLTLDGGAVLTSVQGRPAGYTVPIITKFDSNGAISLYRAYENPDQYAPSGPVAQTADGSKYVTIIGHQLPSDPNGPYGLFVFVVDSGGNVVAQRAFAAPDGGREYPLALIRTSDGGFASISTEDDYSRLIFRKFNADASAITFERLITPATGQQVFYAGSLSHPADTGSFSQTSDGGFLIGGHTAKASSGFAEDAALMKLHGDGTVEFVSIIGGIHNEGGPNYGASGSIATPLVDGGYGIAISSTTYVTSPAGDDFRQKADWWLLKTDANRKVRNFTEIMTDLSSFNGSASSPHSPVAISYLSTPPYSAGPITGTAPEFTLVDLASKNGINQPSLAVQASGPRVVSPRTAEAIVGQHFAYHIITAFFPDFTKLVYSVTGLPDGFVLDAQNGVISGIAKAGTETVETNKPPIPITLHVTDGADSCDAVVNLAISDGFPQFTVNDSSTPSYPDPSATPVAGLADQPLTFVAKQAGNLPARVMTVEASTNPGNPGSWLPLATATDGFMKYDSIHDSYVLGTTAYPAQNNVFFRARLHAPSRPDLTSNVVGPFNLASTSGNQRMGTTALYITNNGPVANIRYGVTQTPAPSGVSVKIQSTTTPASEATWTDISGGAMTQDSAAPTEFYLGLDEYPDSTGVYFRAVASLSGYVDSLSGANGPFTFIRDPAPTVTINVPNAGSAAQDFDFPANVQPGSFNVTVSAQSARAMNRLTLMYDGDTLEHFDGATSGTTLYTTNVMGDHLIEAAAADDLHVVGYARPIHVRVAPPAPGRLLFITASGNWSDASIWTDATGSHAVPGPDDFAVLSDVNVTLTGDVTVGALSLNGGTVDGAHTLTVNKSFTIGGGRIKSDVLVADGATCLMINDTDLALGGTVTMAGRLKIHGKGGVTGIRNGTATRADGVTSPDGFFDGIVAAWNNLGKILFHPPAGGRKGSAKATPPTPPVTAPEVRTVLLGVLNNKAEIVAQGGGNIVAQGGGNIISTNGGGIVAQGGGNIVAQGGGNLINQDGASLKDKNGNKIVAQGGGNIVAQGAGNIVAQGGGNIVAQGGGNIISTNGGGIVAQGGGNIVAQGGGNLVATGGPNIVAQGGGNIISGNGSAIVAQGGGNLARQRALSASVPAQPASTAGFVQDGGRTDLSQINIIGSVELKGGILSGTGSIVGDVANKGAYIMPGQNAPGVIGITGNFGQDPAGTTVIDAASGEAGEFDQVQVGGTAALGGKLDFHTTNSYVPLAGDQFSPLGFSSVTGSFASATQNAQASVTSTGVTAVIDPTKPNPPAGQPLNIATRMGVQAGDNVLIAGFIVSGPNGSTKKVLIRGIGPSLAQFGVSGTISDPLLELHKSDGTVTNDNWQQGDTSQIPNGFAPGDSRESVIVATLTPGNYSALLRGAHGETGVGIAEVYDLDPASPAKLANIATRGFINTGDDVMIGGFIVGGAEPAKILVRVVGPTLADFGVQGALADPTLELHDSNGMTISNDDWRETQESEIIATTIPPNKSQEPAILATLVPGNYTAVVRGKNNTTGVGLVEAYNLQ